MLPERKEKLIGICNTIAKETKNDINESEGQAFNGRNVAEMFGKQAAAIVALAAMVKEILEND